MPQISEPSQAQYGGYFDHLFRGSRLAWVGSGLTAAGLNLMLFLGLPHLMDQGSPAQTVGTLVEDIQVIHIKQPETPVKRKVIQPPPPREKQPVKKPNKTTSPPTQTELTLPFEVNPQLPGGPDSLPVPELKSGPLIHLEVSDLFSQGQLDAPLTVLARIPPVYPLRARNRGIQGWVKVSFIVDTSGQVTDISILDSEPASIFDQSVIRCVGSWRFKPGTIDGMVVKAKLETTIRFELE